jgi:ribonuclease I
MKKELTKKDYDNYMKVVNQNIKETERRLEILDKTKKVSQLSFEDWVKFQNGELKIS